MVIPCAGHCFRPGKGAHCSHTAAATCACRIRDLNDEINKLIREKVRPHAAQHTQPGSQLPHAAQHSQAGSHLPQHGSSFLDSSSGSDTSSSSLLETVPCPSRQLCMSIPPTPTQPPAANTHNCVSFVCCIPCLTPLIQHVNTLCARAVHLAGTPDVQLPVHAAFPVACCCLHPVGSGSLGAPHRGAGWARLCQNSAQNHRQRGQ